MNKIMMLAIIGIIAIAIIGVSFGFATQDTSNTQTLAKSCGKCNGTCTAENNCGLASCGAVTGGTCTCNKSGSCSGSCSATTGTCGSATCAAAKGTGSCGCSK